MWFLMYIYAKFNKCEYVSMFFIWKYKKELFIQYFLYLYMISDNKKYNSLKV